MQSWHITQDYKKMNPESIDRLIAKNPKLRNKRQKLEQMHDGAPEPAACRAKHMRGEAYGNVRDINYIFSPAP